MTRAKDEATATSAERLREIQVLAAQDAARYFGGEPAGPCRAAPAMTPGRAWSKPVGVCAGVAVFAVGSWSLAPDRAASAVREVQADPMMMAAVRPTAGAPSLPRTPAVRVPRAPALTIERSGSLWRIHSGAGSRYEAARALARLSNTALPAGIDALQGTKSLDLRWEGTDLGEAWRMILGSEVNYALQCRNARCMAWVIQPGAPEQAATTPDTRKANGATVASAYPALSRGTTEPSSYD